MYSISILCIDKQTHTYSTYHTMPYIVMHIHTYIYVVTGTFDTQTHSGIQTHMHMYVCILQYYAYYVCTYVQVRTHTYVLTYIGTYFSFVILAEQYYTPLHNALTLRGRMMSTKLQHTQHIHNHNWITTTGQLQLDKHNWGHTATHSTVHMSLFMNCVCGRWEGGGGINGAPCKER